MVGHYNGRRHREPLIQFDFVGRGSNFGTTKISSRNIEGGRWRRLCSSHEHMTYSCLRQGRQDPQVEVVVNLGQVHEGSWTSC